MNLINSCDISCKSVSCSFYWAPMPSTNPVGTWIPITTWQCLAWKMPSNIRFIIDCQKSSFSHLRILKSESTHVVLAKAFANPLYNMRNCSKRPFRSSHPIMKNVVWSCLSMRSLEPVPSCKHWRVPDDVVQWDQSSHRAKTLPIDFGMDWEPNRKNRTVPSQQARTTSHEERDRAQPRYSSRAQS